MLSRVQHKNLVKVGIWFRISLILSPCVCCMLLKQKIDTSYNKDYLLVSYMPSFQQLTVNIVTLFLNSLLVPARSQ